MIGAEIFSVYGRMRLDKGDFDRDIDNVENRGRGLAGTLGGVGKAAVAMGAGIVAAAKGAGVAAVHIGGRVDDMGRSIQAQTRQTVEHQLIMTEQAIRFADSSGNSFGSSISMLDALMVKYGKDTLYDALLTAWAEAMDTEDYLGITRGGTNSSLENESRVVEYDGRRVRSVGDFVVDSANPQISTTLLMHSVENLRRVMPMSDVQEDAGGKVTIRPRLGTPRPEDYMTSLSWVREMTNGDIKIVTIPYAINTENYTQTGADKSESEIPVTFTGNARKWDDTEYAPYEEVIFPRVVTP